MFVLLLHVIFHSHTICMLSTSMLSGLHYLTARLARPQPVLSIILSGIKFNNGNI